MSERMILVCGMSRSGTTLGATILDAHPDVAMGYELLPSGLGDLGAAADVLGEVVESGLAFGRVADALKGRGLLGLAKFVKLARRALVEPDRLVGVIREVARLGGEPDDLAVRAALSVGVARIKREITGAEVAGFKLNAPSIGVFDGALRGMGVEGVYVMMTRDPRDVYASHAAHGFGKTREQVCAAWNGYLGRFLAFKDANPERVCELVRYEDLVCDPDGVIGGMLGGLGLAPSGEARAFYTGKASVHARGHRNSDRLSGDIDATSVCRWMGALSVEDAAGVQDECAALMARVGYRRVNVSRGVFEPMRTEEGQKKRAAIMRKAKFFRDQYGELVLPIARGRTNLTWGEACKGEIPVEGEVCVLRHDVDHDLDTAVEMAEWEHGHGLRATYCILHTAIYYGRLVGEGTAQGYEHSNEMLLKVKRIQALGHEINLHNNLAVLGLTEGIDPERVLLEELAWWRRNGVVIDGTSTHGDALCREIDFRNFELFKGREYAARGGKRTIEHGGNRVDLGVLEPERYGMHYEAYDLVRDLYLSDSGGNLRIRRNTRGKAGLRRKQMDPAPAYGKIVGILTHPVWWDMTRDAPKGARIPELDELVEGDVLGEAAAGVV